MYDEKNINYFLARSNAVKLGGYTSIEGSFLRDLFIFVNPNKESISWYVKKYNVYSNSTHSFYDFCKVIWKPGKRYISSSMNPVVSDIYKKSRLLLPYKELAFLLFITGMVEPLDYLKCTNDINFVVSKFSVAKYQYSTRDDNIVDRLKISYSGYIELMLLFLKATTEGTDFGFSVYDYIYHITTKKEAKGYIKNEMYYQINGYIEKYSISDFSKFIENTKESYELLFEGNFLRKYLNEIGCMLPFIYSPLVKKYGSERVDRLLDYILFSADILLVEFLLNSKTLIQVMGSRGIVYKECLT